MTLFDSFSGMLLFNLVVSGAKIAGVFILRVFIWANDLHFVDPVTCATFAASYGLEESDWFSDGLSPHSESASAPRSLASRNLSPEERAWLSKPRGTALHKAVARGLAEHAAALLSAGADKEALDSRGKTPLHLAAAHGRTDVAKVLVDMGAKKDEKDNEGKTPLHLAAAHGRTDVAKVLVDMGAKKDEKDNEGKTPLHGAANRGHADVAKLLVDMGADKAILGEALIHPSSLATLRILSWWTPLHAAAAVGRTDVAKLLMDMGWTPLHVAASNGHADVAKLLMDMGAKKALWGGRFLHGARTRRTTRGGRPFMWLPVMDTQMWRSSSWTWEPRRTRRTTRARHPFMGLPIVDTQMWRRFSWTWEPIRTRRTTMGGRPFIWLPKKDMQMWRRFSWTWEPIRTRRTTMAGSSGFVEHQCGEFASSGELLEYRACGACETPLHWAARTCETDMLKLLVNMGAKKDAKDNEGRTARDLAEENGDRDVAELL
ncbi:ANK3 [Symbiodinium natans]|uniref:ANK3 protein n=1 Tax=Symbiodinium natans TaxID=878477 RepID=A0A812VD79_9DINO|nr:ANK3 [Symbiodinium natans]